MTKNTVDLLLSYSTAAKWFWVSSMAGSLLGVRIFRIKEEQSVMFQPRDQKHTWIIYLWPLYMANPSAPQAAITFQFKGSLGSTDFPSEDIVWMLILTFCSTLVCDSTFPSAGFTGPMESVKTELCQSPGTCNQPGQCTKGWEGVTDCSSGSTEFHTRKLPCENSAPGLCWSSDTAPGGCRSSEGSMGFELQGTGCSHLWVAVSCQLQEHSHSSHERHTQPWCPLSCSALALPLPQVRAEQDCRDTAALLRLPEPPYTWRHNTTLVHWPLTPSHQMSSADVVGLLH